MNCLNQALGLLFLLCGGCQSMAPVRVSQLQVSPPSLMLAKKNPNRLFIVLDPRRIPDQYTIPQGEIKEIQIFELQTFVRRDLKRAMESYFENVEVVAPGFAFPAAPYWKAEVRIDKLSTKVIKAMSRDNPGIVAAQIFGEMTWAFALGAAEASEYLFSYAGSSVGSYSMTHVSETGTLFASTFEAAIGDMQKSLTDKGGLEKLIAKPLREEEPSTREESTKPSKTRRARPR